MALSVQNKNFLGVLNKLGIDVKQFPDSTFDGLFENIPEDMNYFFNWFIENITSDNALNQSEQATYFQLENTQSLPTEEEMNYVLASCNPSYEELMSLDANYIQNYLSKDLEDLRKYHTKLSDIYTETETHYCNIIKKQNNLKESITAKNKLLNSITEDSREACQAFGSKIDEVKMFLLKEPQMTLRLDLFSELLVKEGNILNKFKNCQLLDKKIFNCTKLDSLSELEKDITYIDISFLLSEGFLKGKKAKIEILSDMLQKKSSQKSFNSYNTYQFYHVNNDGIDLKIIEEIKALESELFEKQRILSHAEVQKISDEYYFRKIDLNKSYIMKLTECRDYIKFNWKIKSCLLHILLRSIDYLEETINTRKQLCCKLNEYETNLSNDITNLELRNQRFKEVSQQNPLKLALKNVINLEGNPENNKESLKNVLEFMSHANDDSNFITHKFRNDIQSSIRGLFSDKLCGPTNQILFAPIDLLIKFQECREQNNKLSQVVKRLASKYMETKETISRSDRRRLLLWIHFLTNPQALLDEINQPSSSLK